MRATIAVKDLKRIIQATKKFTSQSDIRPSHQFIRLEFSKEFASVTAVAVDGCRLSVEHAVCDRIDEDFSAYILADIPRSRTSDFAIIEVLEDICYIKIGDSITGYKQPKGDFLDYKKLISNIEKDPPHFRIGFNGALLLSALQAAQASCGGSFKQPVILEFRGQSDPVVLRTNKEDIKLVLPVRIKQYDDNK